MSSMDQKARKLFIIWSIVLFIIIFILIFALALSRVNPLTFFAVPVLAIILGIPLLLILRRRLGVTLPSATNSRTYKCPLDKAYNASLSALKESNFQIKEERKNSIKATSGFSLSSYGENIEVFLSLTADGIEIRVTSKPKWPLQLSGFAKCEANVSKFLLNMKKHMLPVPSDLERKVLDYMEAHQYKVRISECAEELGKTYEEIQGTLKSLEDKGLLKKKGTISR